MILIFAGAGASSAINPEKFPTTLEYFKRLPEKIKNHSSFKIINSYLSSGGMEPIDIEAFIGEVVYLASHFEDQVDQQDVVYNYMSKFHRLSKSADYNQNTIDKLQLDIEKEIGRLNNLKWDLFKNVHSFYNQIPSIVELEKWIHLLEKTKELEVDVEIFTTNYDLVLEAAIEKSGITVKTGRIDSYEGSFLDLEEWNDQNKLGLLTKLHGSFNWHWSGERIAISPEPFLDIPFRHVVLYPGFKDDLIKKEPYASFYFHLQNVVYKAKIAIFIGYSFRDTGINHILNGLTGRGRRIFNLNPEKDLPIDTGLNEEFIEQCESIPKRFSIASVRECLKEIRETDGGAFVKEPS